MIVHGRHRFAWASARIVIEKVASLRLKPGGPDTAVLQLSPSATDSRLDSILGSFDMLNPLRDSRCDHGLELRVFRA